MFVWESRGAGSTAITTVDRYTRLSTTMLSNGDSVEVTTVKRSLPGKLKLLLSSTTAQVKTPKKGSSEGWKYAKYDTKCTDGRPMFVGDTIQAPGAGARNGALKLVSFVTATGATERDCGAGSTTTAAAPLPSSLPTYAFQTGAGCSICDASTAQASNKGKTSKKGASYSQFRR